MYLNLHKDGVEFVIIIDEEHLNNTKKADDVINAFAAKNIIRVSATANKVPHQEFYEISEDDVIGAGLITWRNMSGPRRTSSATSSPATSPC